MQIVMLEGGGTPCSALINVVEEDDGQIIVICWIAGGQYYEIKLKKHIALRFADTIKRSLT